jgi:hypothetical protein
LRLSAERRQCGVAVSRLSVATILITSRTIQRINLDRL